MARSNRSVFISSPLAFASLGLALFALGCEQEAASDGTGGKPPVEIEERGDAPPPAPAGHGLRYGDRVKAPTSGAAANAPTHFEGGWKLQAGQRVDYAYTQLMAGRVGTKGGEQQVEGAGMLSVEGTSAETANVVLRELELKMKMSSVGETKERTQRPGEQTLKNLINLKEGAAPPEDPMVAAMLTVPTAKIAVGASVSDDVRMPLSSRGGQLWASGKMTTTLKGFVACGDHACAHLERELSISDVEVPKGMDGTYKALVKQRGVMLFDTTDRVLHSWSGASHISLQGEANVGGGEGAASQPAELKTIDMAQDHFHELVRKPASAAQPSGG